MKKRTLAIITAFLLAAALLSGCGASGGQQPSPSVSPLPSETAITVSAQPSGQPEAPAQKTDVSVAALIGPTGMGLVKLMDDQDQGKTQNNYSFILSGTPDDIVAKITSGEADIAAVPVNLAPTLYNKTSGNVKLLAINTLGVLYVVENGNTVKTLADLKGKTLYASGQAATPEYALNYILSKNGIKPGTDVTIEYKADHSELASLVMADKADLAVLPEPFVTTVTGKDKDVHVALDLTKEWQGIKDNNGSSLIMGVMIVRKDFADKNPEALSIFMDEYKASTEYVNANARDASVLVEKYGIMASAALAEKAIPNCNIVYIDGQEMKDQIAPFYQILFDMNPKSIGGALPDDAFYYIKQ
jgi:NitT/TauT family transport system substrate-binding protein